MDDQPLFRNMDEQEHVYAPQQIPGDTTDTRSADTDGKAMVGAEGMYTPPVIPAQSIIGSTANMPVPPGPVPDALTNREAEADTRGPE